jgi:hypothetical protein
LTGPNAGDDADFRLANVSQAKFDAKTNINPDQLKCACIDHDKNNNPKLGDIGNEKIVNALKALPSCPAKNNACDIMDTWDCQKGEAASQPKQVTDPISMQSKRTLKTAKIIHEGEYAVEIPVKLIEDETAPLPHLSPGEAQKLQAAQLALEHGDVTEAAKYGRVFELTPVEAK